MTPQEETTEEAIYDAVEYALHAGMTPQDFMRILQRAWSDLSRETAELADKYFEKHRKID